MLITEGKTALRHITEELHWSQIQELVGLVQEFMIPAIHLKHLLYDMSPPFPTTFHFMALEPEMQIR